MLADQLNIPLRASFLLQEEDFEAVGYDSALEAIWYDQSPLAYFRQVAPFHLELLRKLLAAPQHFLIDLEPEYTVYEEPALFAQAQKVLQPFENVVLLTPAPDPQEAARLVKQRMQSWYEGWNEINDFMVDHVSNYRLAKLIHYTAGKTPQESCQEIITGLSRDEPDSVILIGPVNTGKSTLGRLLAQELGRPQAKLDALRDKYYSEIGFDQMVVRRIRAMGTAWEFFNYGQPFHPHGVERVLADYPRSVIDFGAGHSVFTDETLLKRVEKALAPYPNVILILPSADKTETKRLLRERSNRMFAKMNELDEHLARHPSGPALAKIEVYTEGKSPQQICDEVLTRVKL
jgi:hypothetical protein